MSKNELRTLTMDNGGCNGGNHMYGIWNAIEDLQEVRDYSAEQVIDFANIERVVVTGIREEITTLAEAEDFLLTLGYIVEEM